MNIEKVTLPFSQNECLVYDMSGQVSFLHHFRRSQLALKLLSGSIPRKLELLLPRCRWNFLRDRCEWHRATICCVRGVTGDGETPRFVSQGSYSTSHTVEQDGLAGGGDDWRTPAAPNTASRTPQDAEPIAALLREDDFGDPQLTNQWVLPNFWRWIMTKK